MYISLLNFILSKEDEVARNRDRFLVHLKPVLYSFRGRCVTVFMHGCQFHGFENPLQIFNVL